MRLNDIIRPINVALFLSLCLSPCLSFIAPLVVPFAVPPVRLLVVSLVMHPEEPPSVAEPIDPIAF